MAVCLLVYLSPYLAIFTELFPRPIQSISCNVPAYHIGEGRRHLFKKVLPQISLMPELAISAWRSYAVKLAKCPPPPHTS